MRFDSDAFLRILSSEEMHDWIMTLHSQGFLNRYERTVQTYIVSYVLMNCFYGEGALYEPRPIKIEERPNSIGEDPIPDISLPSQNYAGVPEVWIELKDYFGQIDLTPQDLRDLEWDFTKAADASDEGNMGIVLIVGEDRVAIMGGIEEAGLVESFPQVEVIVIGGVSPYA